MNLLETYIRECFDIRSTRGHPADPLLRAPWSASWRLISVVRSTSPESGTQVKIVDLYYQANSWSRPRRVVAKIEGHRGELFPGSVLWSLTPGSPSGR